MSVVARLHTPLTMHQIASELELSWGGRVPALLLAQVAVENARGGSVYNYNLGNLSGYDGRAYDVALAPWATPELIAAAPESQRARYEQLRQRMLKNQVPKYFRAYGSAGAGADAYVRFVRSPGYAPMVSAAESDDPRGFAAAVVSTGYCPDKECGDPNVYHALANELADMGLVEYQGTGRVPQHVTGLGVALALVVAVAVWWGAT